MPEALSYQLHRLTARLDRAADRLLRQHEGISYSRFLALFAASEGAATQRELAGWLGQSEPSTSRMVRVLTAQGLLTVTAIAGSGNRHQLRLTDDGAELVGRCAGLLERHFEELVSRSAVPFKSYQRHTRLLLNQLEADQHEAAATRSAA